MNLTLISWALTLSLGNALSQGLLRQFLCFQEQRLPNNAYQYDNNLKSAMGSFQQKLSFKGDKASIETYNRRFAMSSIVLLAAQCVQPRKALGFEGGIGGLGKTKPRTGVILWDSDSTPSQSTSGIVSAELNVANRAVLVAFQSPWPLTGPLETRSVATGESAFVQVVEELTSSRINPKSGKEAMKQVLVESVLAQQGKFGAYGSPFDIRIKSYEISEEGVDSGTSILCNVSFTTLTPGLRESEREVFVRAIDAFNDNNQWVLLVTGMSRQGFSKQKGTFAKIADSFQVVSAPKSNLRKSLK